MVYLEGIGPLPVALRALVLASPRAAQLWRELHARGAAMASATPEDLEADPEFRFLSDALADELERVGAALLDRGEGPGR